MARYGGHVLGADRVQDDAGAWHEVDTTLMSDGSGAFTTKASPLQVTVGEATATKTNTGAPQQGSAADPATVVSVGDLNEVSADAKESDQVIVGWAGDLPAPTVDGSVATFAQVAAGMDVSPDLGSVDPSQTRACGVLATGSPALFSKDTPPASSSTALKPFDSKGRSTTYPLAGTSAGRCVRSMNVSTPVGFAFTRRMYCGKRDSTQSESAFGLRHIRAGHKADFASYAALDSSQPNRNWGNFMHFTIWKTVQQPRRATVQNANRYCLQATFQLKRLDNRQTAQEMDVAVILGRTGTRIMSAFPGVSKEYCKGVLINGL